MDLEREHEQERDMKSRHGRGDKNSYSSPPSLSPRSPSMAKTNGLRVGDTVEIVLRSGLSTLGWVRFLGNTHFAPSGIWAGLELVDPLGLHNGTVLGREYFDCAPLHGMFLRPGHCARRNRLDRSVAATSALHTTRSDRCRAYRRRRGKQNVSHISRKSDPDGKYLRAFNFIDPTEDGRALPTGTSTEEEELREALFSHYFDRTGNGWCNLLEADQGIRDILRMPTKTTFDFAQIVRDAFALSRTVVEVMNSSTASRSQFGLTLESFDVFLSHIEKFNELWYMFDPSCGNPEALDEDELNEALWLVESWGFELEDVERIFAACCDVDSSACDFLFTRWAAAECSKRTTLLRQEASVLVQVAASRESLGGVILSDEEGGSGDESLTSGASSKCAGFGAGESLFDTSKTDISEGLSSSTSLFSLASPKRQPDKVRAASPSSASDEDDNIIKALTRLSDSRCSSSTTTEMDVRIV